MIYKLDKYTPTYIDDIKEALAGLFKEFNK